MQTSSLKDQHSTESKQKVKIAVAAGDGIGPEIMSATLKILDAAGANIEPEQIEIGEKAYLSNYTSGITDKAWDTVNEAKIILKAPITTPQGKGYKSLNVTLRKSLNLFANIRPCRSLHPYIKTLHPNMDVVIVRENEEDLYAGIEHQQTAEVLQCLKLISIPGSEKIIRKAFQYAVENNRKKVTCMVKDNIMKLTDGVFHEIFRKVGEEYPSIKQDVQIIDIGAARLATQPENYDVVVTLNLYGDIISDITAELAGSVGMAGSSNIGTNYAMFEAIHGSAPDISGQNIANPSGLLNAAVMMLQHLGQVDTAQKISNAWLKTLEDGIHTADIFNGDFSTAKVGTSEFADAVIERLGQIPTSLAPIHIESPEVATEKPITSTEYVIVNGKKSLVGVDIFVDFKDRNPNVLGELLTKVGAGSLKLKMITNRGVKVYPGGNPETFCTDHWRCRFVSSDAVLTDTEKSYQAIEFSNVLETLNQLTEASIEVIKTENLYKFGEKLGFSLGQGE